MHFVTSASAVATEASRSNRRTLPHSNKMIFSLVLLSVAALVVAEPEAKAEAPQRRYAVPSAPTLAYVAAPLVVGSQRAALANPAAAPAAAALLAYSAPASTQQQYVARTYNGITTLALEQREAAPVAAPLVAAPAEPVSSRFVVSSAPAARVVVAEAEPAPLRFYTSSANLVYPAPAAPAANLVYSAPAAPAANLVYSAPAAPAANLVYTASAAPAAKLVYSAPAAPAANLVYSYSAPAANLVYSAPAAPAVAAAAPARVVAVTPQVAPTSSSSQYFSRNYNGVPAVTYFVVGPSPVTAPVAVAPQQGALPPRRPAPGTSPTPAGEPVNQGDVEVLDA